MRKVAAAGFAKNIAGRKLGRAGGRFRPAWLRVWTLLLLAISGPIALGAEPMTPIPGEHRVKVRPFPEGLDWLNTPRPLQWADLRGKFVLLDFWTLGCINCIHIMPELAKLEEAYPDELVVIGVHSGKFSAERQSRSIGDAIARFRIAHPVINDAEFAVWNQYAVDAWPTLVLVDPEGYVVWARSGEVTFEQLDTLFKRLVPFYDRQKLLDRRPLKLAQKAEEYDSPLRFPGKVLADEAGGRLFIADSNHNRIVIASLDGKVTKVIGAGTIGASDGTADAAQFNQPQGMALWEGNLYVADAGNHLVRKIDLSTGTVATIAGTGRQSRELPPFVGAPNALKTPLSSPWDLLVHNGQLYIAMAGPHQIWRMKLDGTAIGVYAGNGREDIIDGPLAPRRPYQLGFSSFAQPSGLASDGQWLYVADCEGSSIRAVPFDSSKRVRTVVGTAELPRARLFTFGDVDGLPPQARLQHPLCVAFYRQQLYVADTYNHKIKRVDPATGETRTLSGTGRAGRSDDPAEFNEPAGLSAAGGKLYVADTNNHLIRVIDLDDGNRVSTLALTGVARPK